MATPAQPYILAPLGGEGYNSGYSLNIHEKSAAGFGMRICQIPPFTWRSREAVLKLGHELRATPVLIEALEGAIGALEFSRDFIRDDEDHNPEDLALAQDKLDAAILALAIAKGEAA